MKTSKQGESDADLWSALEEVVAALRFINRHTPLGVVTREWIEEVVARAEAAMGSGGES